VTSNDSRVRLYDLRDLTLTCKYKGCTNNSSQIKASFRCVFVSARYCWVYVWNVLHKVRWFDDDLFIITTNISRIKSLVYYNKMLCSLHFFEYAVAVTTKVDFFSLNVMLFNLLLCKTVSFLCIWMSECRVCLLMNQCWRVQSWWSVHNLWVGGPVSLHMEDTAWVLQVLVSSSWSQWLLGKCQRSDGC